MQQIQKLLAGDGVSLLEFWVAIAGVGLWADAANDPLARVSAEVQDQIADTVWLFISSPPDLRVSQLFQAALNLRQIIAQQKLRRMSDKRPGSSMFVFAG